jgi:hypothetical protein
METREIPIWKWSKLLGYFVLLPIRSQFVVSCVCLSSKLHGISWYGRDLQTTRYAQTTVMVRVDDVTDWLYVTGFEWRVSYRICNIFMCVTLIRPSEVERIDSCAVVRCDAMDAHICVCRIGLVDLNFIGARKRKERKWVGGYRKYQIIMDGSPVGQSDCTGHTPGKKQRKKIKKRVCHRRLSTT